MIGDEDVSSYEITACHRLAKKDVKHPAPTIVRFTNRKHVEYCLRNRKLLLRYRNQLNMNLRFFENLCSENESIVANCTKLKNEGIIKNYIVRNGFAKILHNNGTSKKIKHPEELHSLFRDFFDSLDS